MPAWLAQEWADLAAAKWRTRPECKTENPPGCDPTATQHNANYSKEMRHTDDDIARPSYDSLNAVPSHSHRTPKQPQSRRQRQNH